MAMSMMSTQTAKQLKNGEQTAKQLKNGEQIKITAETFPPMRVPPPQRRRHQPMTTHHQMGRRCRLPSYSMCPTRRWRTAGV